MLKLLTFVSLTLSFNLWAADAKPETNNHQAEIKFYSRQDWGAQPAGPNLYTHKDRGFKHELPKTIILEHTVIDLGDSIKTLQYIQRTQMDVHGFFKYSDIAFNLYIDTSGNEFEGRAKEIIPIVYPGKNLGNYVVGFIGRFDDHQDAREVDKSMVIKWGKSLGKLAFDLEFGSLAINKNVFTICQLVKNANPRKKIFDKLHLIIYIANQHLMDLRENQLKK